MAMLRNRRREKLIQAILYFAQNTRHLGKIKLFKLLYLLDFEHFRQTGASVTGMEYRAWKMGPVPFRLMQEWDAPEQDFVAAINIQPRKIFDYEREEVSARQAFDPSHFSKRELNLLDALASQYRDTLSEKMIDVTHAENGAWETVWAGGMGNDQVIDYSLSIAADDPHRDAILAAAADFESIAAAQGQ
jgi:uncharacterized phage-associated protein